jgi:hypothetical protein
MLNQKLKVKDLDRIEEKKEIKTSKLSTAAM